MEDSSISPSKVETFRRLYETVIQAITPITKQNSTNVCKYTPPAMPRVATSGLVELVLDPDIPASLIHGLDRFTESLEEDQLDDNLLGKAEEVMQAAGVLAAMQQIGAEDSVLTVFSISVVAPVRALCNVLGMIATYEGGPKVANLNPDHAWKVNGKAAIVFEHKVPAVFNHHSSQILSMARRRHKLNLKVASTDTESILAKNVQSGRTQARISEVIPLTSPTTPIISLVLALILHSRRDGSALEYQPLRLNDVATPSDVPNEDDEHLGLGPTGPGLYSPADQQGETSSSSYSSAGQVFAPKSLAVTEYWEPQRMSEPTLAALLRTTDGITLYWEMKQFSREMFRPVRRDDSSLWGDSPPIDVLPPLVVYSPGHHGGFPPSPATMAPFVLELNSAVGHGAVGSVYEGNFLGLSLPLIVKILPMHHMDHELTIWRRLRDLAGTCVPGLFGAYSLEGQEGYEDTGALVQQHAGATLWSFDTLDQEQRFIILLPKSMRHMSSMGT
ncbi:hypothetical protein FRC00_002304 [Tulasnella sp. 408]|nr:hypothetical protein FRC00_002304 [Tulasnella sp. 408]